VRRYFGRKLLIYILTFFLAVTIDWLIPRFMPGNPVQILLQRFTLRANAAQAMYNYYTHQRVCVSNAGDEGHHECRAL
jgi:peptide/nickel transport system permease protein